MYPYRVFLSYSHKDRELAKKMARHLEGIGCCAVWDEKVRPGDRFSETLRHGIAHAHVFLPILTANAVKRPWVHQETGYAMGLEVPVLPVAIGRIPGEMIRELHALTVRPDLRDLKPEVLAAAVEHLLGCARPESEATFRCAALPEMRAELLACYTREALEHGASGPLRQSGALTSFNLPNRPVHHEAWRLRDAPLRRGELLYKLLRDERQVLETYARKNGCDLIIDPSVPMGPYRPRARRLRLATLLEFLRDDSVANLRIAVRRRKLPGNLTIVGDWFAAESITPRPGKGYFQTIFTWHAPSVLETLRRFDEELQSALDDMGVPEDSAREAAIDAVKRELARIKA